MAVLEGGVSAALAGIGAEAASPLHVTPKPIPYGSLGHYRVAHRCALVAAQAANSRIFELRNSHATNLLVLTSLKIQWLQTAAHTAAIEDSLDFYRCTGFSAVDTTNTVTPTASVKRVSMTAAPGSAAVRGVTVAGASAGMTGGTLTKETSPAFQLPQWLLLALPTASTVLPAVLDKDFGADQGAHPYVFVQNEGLIIENRALLGAAAGSSVYIDCSWAEVAAF